MSETFKAEVTNVNLYKSVASSKSVQQVWVEMRIITDITELDYFKNLHKKGVVKIEFID